MFILTFLNMFNIYIHYENVFKSRFFNVLKHYSYFWVLYYMYQPAFPGCIARRRCWMTQARQVRPVIHHVLYTHPSHRQETDRMGKGQ